MTATELGRLLAERAEQTAQFLLPGGKRHGREWLAGSIHGEAGSSLKVVLDGSKAGMWRDFAGGDDEKGDMIALWRLARGVTLSQACQEALDWMQVPDSVRNTRRPPSPKASPKPKAPDQRWIDLQAQLRAGTYREIQALAEQRRLSTAALELATKHGHLFFASVHDTGERHPAWILTDPSRRHAQARKMDGSLWQFGGSHKPAKSKTIWGTDSHWPVGLANANTPEVALVEGAPDMLAAWQLIYEAGLVHRRRPVAMFGASTSIGEDALPLFAGKTVFIFPHNDGNNAGQKGAARWHAQLTPHAAHVSICPLADCAGKDLNDAVVAMQNSEEPQSEAVQ